MNPEIKLQIDRFTTAAEALLEVGTSRRPGGKSETLFAGGGRPSKTILAALSVPAAEQGFDIVYLEFRLDDVARGPRSVWLITPRDGVHRVIVDCAFWAPEDGGRLVIVPRLAQATHFDFENDELVQRAGRPARSLDAGIARAMERLRATAATMPGGQGTELRTDLPPSG